MQLICTGPAIKTLQEVSRLARQTVIEESIDDVDEDESVTQEIIISKEKAFYQYIEREYTELDGFDNSAQFTNHLYQEYHRIVMNKMHSVIFGSESYRSYKQQKNYMKNSLIKPF